MYAFVCLRVCANFVGDRRTGLLSGEVETGCYHNISVIMLPCMGGPFSASFVCFPRGRSFQPNLCCGDARGKNRRPKVKIGKARQQKPK